MKMSINNQYQTCGLFMFKCLVFITMKNSLHRGDLDVFENEIEHFLIIFFF